MAKIIRGFLVLVNDSDIQASDLDFDSISLFVDIFSKRKKVVKIAPPTLLKKP